MSNETKTFIGFGAATLIIVILGVFFFSKEPSQKEPVSVNPEILVREDSRKDISSEEKVVLVEFGDYQCPACSAYHQIVKPILEEDETIAYVFRHFPLSQHKNARSASKAAEASGMQDKYFEMHDMLYEKQGEWENLSDPMPKFEEYAATLSLDLSKFAKDYNSSEVDAKISRDYADGVALGVNSTPTFYANGKKLSGIKNRQDFERLIKEYSAEENNN